MRVLHFHPINNLGGSTQSMLTLIREMAKEGPTFAVVMFDNDQAQACRDAGAEVRTFYGKRSLPPTRLQRMWCATRCLHQAVCDWKIDLLHSHSATGVRFLYLTSRWNRKKIVCHARDNYKNDYYHRGLDWSHHVITVSKWIQKGLPESIRQKSTVIYNAVFPPELSLCKLPKLGDPVVIGCAGRCIPEKGIDLFIAALGNLADRTDYKATIWGIPDPEVGDAYGNELRRTIATLPEACQRRIDIQPFRLDMDNFYSSTDVVVVPSRFAEPMGRMAIEAMAWRNTTIVANHGGLSELVAHGDTGLVFEPASVGSLTEQLRAVLDDSKLRQRLAEAGREEAITRFSPSSHARAMNKVYQQLLSS